MPKVLFKSVSAKKSFLILVVRMKLSFLACFLPIQVEESKHSAAQKWHPKMSFISQKQFEQKNSNCDNYLVL